MPSEGHFILFWLNSTFQYRPWKGKHLEYLIDIQHFFITVTLVQDDVLLNAHTPIHLKCLNLDPVVVVTKRLGTILNSFALVLIGFKLRIKRIILKVSLTLSVLGGVGSSPLYQNGYNSLNFYTRNLRMGFIFSSWPCLDRVMPVLVWGVVFFKRPVLLGLRQKNQIPYFLSFPVLAPWCFSSLVHIYLKINYVNSCKTN